MRTDGVTTGEGHSRGAFDLAFVIGFTEFTRYPTTVLLVQRDEFDDKESSPYHARLAVTHWIQFLREPREAMRRRVGKEHH